MLLNVLCRLIFVYNRKNQNIRELIGIMKRFCAVFFAVIPLFLYSQAQPKIKEKKYPSLLWEISGNGIKKPSFLIGTMHVSSKMAFHLPDSFYIALRSE